MSPITITLTASLVDYPDVPAVKTTFTVEIAPATWTPYFNTELHPEFIKEEDDGKYKLLSGEDDTAAPEVSLEFRPIVAECKDEAWTEELPGIVGEAEGEKFQLKVDLQNAVQIVTYNPAKRQFTMKKTLSASMAGSYPVLVSITNASNLSSHYAATLELLCEPEQVQSRRN